MRRIGLALLSLIALGACSIQEAQAQPVPPTPAVVVIDGVRILHLVKGAEVDTQALRHGEFAEFLVLYHTTQASAHPTGLVEITRSGALLGKVTLAPLIFEGHQAFGWVLGLSKTAGTGKFYAHFRLTAGAVSVKRDRRFSLSAS